MPPCVSSVAMRQVLAVPADFSFRRTVLAHGWCLLAPYRVAPDARALETTTALPAGNAIRLRMVERPDGVEVSTPGRSRAHLAAAVEAAWRALALDVDLGPFHAAVSREPELSWITEVRAGRLLRCPTAWEDLVKMVLTTNCTWSSTTRMVEALVRLDGAVEPSGTQAFPTPFALARRTEAELRERARLGYRARSILALARGVREGEIDLGAWDRPDASAAALREAMLALPGVGPNVADNLLKLRGRPGGLALDSWMRAKYARLLGRGRPVADTTIARRHARLGGWAGLALWLALTRDWWEGDEPARAWATLT